MHHAALATQCVSMSVGAAAACCTEEAAYCTCQPVEAHLLQVDDSGWNFFTRAAAFRPFL